MEILEKNKGIIIGAVLILVILFGYNFFADKGESVPDTAGPVIGANLLKISAELSRAALNQEIFSDPRYTYLIDFSTVIPDQPKGRNNPFNIIGQ